MPRRNPYGCVFWPTYLSSFFLIFFFVDLPAFLALVRLVLVFPPDPALTGRAMASAFAPALASAVPALTGGAMGASSPATWISTLLVRFKIGVARPIAAWVYLFTDGPSFTPACRPPG